MATRRGVRNSEGTKAMDLEREIDVLEQDVDGHIIRIRKACADIAAELERAPPRDSARITASQREVTNLVRSVMAMLPKLNVAESRLAAQARENDAVDGTPGRLPSRWYSLRTKADRLRCDMNQWHEIQTLLSRQVRARPTPLYIPAEERSQTAVTQADVSDALFNSLHRLINPRDQSAGADDHGCYPDIGLSNSVFIEHAHAAYRVFLTQRRRRGGRFLDVGCGSGLKVVSAAEFFDCADGLEYDAGYADIAKALFDTMGLGHCRVLVGDALDFDDYGAYDVIYFYRPMRDDAAMRALEARITEQALPGTILIAAYEGFTARHADLDCAHIAGNVFVAKTDATTAAELRQAAEHTGESIVRRRTSVPGLWEPILAASHMNGFGIRRLPPIRV